MIDESKRGEELVPTSALELAALAETVRHAVPGIHVQFWQGGMRVHQVNGPAVTTKAGDLLRWDGVRVWRVVQDDLDDRGWDRGGD